MKMHSEGEIHRSFKVGSWDFRPMLKELKAPDGRTVKLEDKISLLLETLCSRDAAVVSKEELIDAVWDGREVSEQTIPVAISKLRKTLGDNSAAPTMLETVPRRGYRMMSDTASGPKISGAGIQQNSFIRVALALALVMVAALAWMVFDKSVNIGTSPAQASKPGIILTINDVRPISKAEGQIDRAIALSELASFYLSQMPDVLVIRHWWNLDAPDPTGGIYTRYGAETPVYSLKSTLLEENGEAAVALILSNPKTEEILWSGLHFVGRGTGDYFANLREMLKSLGVFGSSAVVDSLAGNAILEDERYWQGLYFAHLSNEGAAKAANNAWKAIAEERPDDAYVKSARSALWARWGPDAGGEWVKAPPKESTQGYVGLIDRAAIALFRDSDAARALMLLEAALEVAPGDHYALSLQGEALLLAGDKAGCIEAYKKALRLAPFAKSYAVRLAQLESTSD
ncbi:MAG: hypothetical protein COB37_08505 [Kordiimonadales bacterium]|nr:MAG: hypothetical protein COB37_08505 [Kordiimonadales bacterium]